MKPKYRVPTMKEIEAVHKNGYKVASTFSGGGGSCLGYRMAGFKVVYASEFVEEAQKTYKANHKNSYLDTRDIRNTKAEDILKILNIEKGELDLFDGSPPCSAFSISGKREKGWGKAKDYSDGKVQVVEDLFFEYIRILKGLQPKVFVAENVAGIAKGKAKGYLDIILKEMRKCGYVVDVRILNAMWLGVPQRRERAIFVGVRKDLAEKYGVKPAYPEPFEYYYTVKDAFENLINDDEQAKELTIVQKDYSTYKLLKKMPKNPKRPISPRILGMETHFNFIRESMYCPCSTILQSHGLPSIAGSGFHPLYDRKFTIPELKRIMSIPDDFVLTGSFKQQWERLGRMVPPLMMKAVAETIQKEILNKIGE